MVSFSSNVVVREPDDVVAIVGLDDHLERSRVGAVFPSLRAEWNWPRYRRHSSGLRSQRA
jgi:hypothetical protein